MAEGDAVHTVDEHLRTVQGIYAAFGQGNLPAVLEALADDVEWRVDGPPLIRYAGVRRGRRQVAEFFAALAEAVEMERFEPRRFIAQGDCVVVLGCEQLRVKSTGRTVRDDWVQVFTFQGGRVAQFREYLDSAAVAEAFRGA